MNLNWFKGIQNINQLTGQKYNGDWSQMTQWWNDHDNGVRAWTQSVFGGTTTNDNAAAGQVGEYMEAISMGSNFPATGVYGDALQLPLTSGDWDVSFNVIAEAGATTSCTDWSIGISLTPGNSTGGLILGSNWVAEIAPFTTTVNSSAVISSYRVSLSSANACYGKYQAVYTSSIPGMYGRLSARRMR